MMGKFNNTSASNKELMNSPTGDSMNLGSSSKIVAGSQSSSDSNLDDGGPHQHVRLKKEVGLFEGVAIIIGIIIGSGEKNSPVDCN